jgi:hypothetical protein
LIPLNDESLGSAIAFAAAGGTGNGMCFASKKQGFGQDLVEAMNLVLAHHRGEVKLERVLPKRHSYKATPKQRPIRGK